MSDLPTHALLGYVRCFSDLHDYVAEYALIEAI